MYLVHQIGEVLYEAVYGGDVFKWSPLRRIARLYFFGVKTDEREFDPIEWIGRVL